MDDCIRPAKERHKVVLSDVGTDPFGLGDIRSAGRVMGNSQHRLDRRLVRELLEQARAGVSSCSDDDYAHYG